MKCLSKPALQTRMKIMQVFLSSVSGTNEKKVKFRVPCFAQNKVQFQKMCKISKPTASRRRHSFSFLHPSMMRMMSKFSKKDVCFKTIKNNDIEIT